MGLLSKILGGGADKAGKKLFDEFWKEAGGSPLQDDGPSQQPVQQAAPVQYAAPVQHQNAPSGFSWGPVMPAEENQFNFNGKYHDYFEQVYRSAFPGYSIDKSFSRSGNTVIFTFTKDGRTALVVEVISQKNNPYKLRNDCAKARIPYIRFYYDHYGWWNTRSYVTVRTRKALGL